ncbi:hypothetical protein [Planktosalinus lacus]|uniref:Uncharacterized protein n=1 Tax=Planktosalinus lacus TaxID=1526573 RepID=A0A8J2V8G7_9FLAO|nr:hypothetical protein [Planktosalinus lacus]GGD84123.1 hypothetical protein GCM10011312_05180 [Planktosalinus lacus]
MTSERLKLIWDFHGPDAKKTASHHKVHLTEYAAIQNLELPVSGVERISELHYIAYLVVNRMSMPAVRDALKPHRGQIYTIGN